MFIFCYTTGDANHYFRIKIAETMYNHYPSTIWYTGPNSNNDNTSTNRKCTS